MRMMSLTGPGAVGEVDSAYAWVRLLAAFIATRVSLL